MMNVSMCDIIISINSIMDKYKIYLEYMPHQQGGTQEDILKFRTHCNDMKGVIGWIQATQTLQTSYKYDKRGHVAMAVIKEYPDLNFVVKIQTAGHKLTNNEVSLLRELQPAQYVVRYICDFICNDQELKWKKKVKRPTDICGSGENQIHVILMEFVPNGSLYDYIQDHDISQEKFVSIIRQLYIDIIDMSVNYHVFHGDINGGNILLSSTSEQYISYEICGRHIQVSTMGVLPVFTDFENGIKFARESEPNCEDIIDDIVQMLELFHHRVNCERMNIIRRLIKCVMEQYNKNSSVVELVNVIYTFNFN
jgi:serine/threonine protein kinase